MNPRYFHQAYTGLVQIDIDDSRDLDTIQIESGHDADGRYTYTLCTEETPNSYSYDRIPQSSSHMVHTQNVVATWPMRTTWHCEKRVSRTSKSTRKMGFVVDGVSQSEHNGAMVQQGERDYLTGSP